MSPSSPRPLWRQLGLFAAVVLCFLSSASIGTANDDERISGLQEQIRTLENVINSSNNTNERSRLDIRLQRLRQELGILQERQAIEAKAKNLTEDLRRNTADMLREKLRGIDHSVEEAEARVHDLAARRHQVASERDALVSALNSARARNSQPADKLAEQEERVYTKNEELRAVVLQSEAAEFDVELAHDAERLREELKQFDPHQRSSLRAMFESYSRWRKSKKLEDQVNGVGDDLGRNLKVSQGGLELSRLELAKFDEELALLEKQVSFFNSDPKVERLIANQRSQKKALSERIPFISAQVDALQHSQQVLNLRGDLLQLGTKLQKEQFVALQDSYYQRLRWPAVALGALLALYLLSSYALLPLVMKNEDLILARRLARYAGVLLSVGVVAGFLFDDLSVVAATLGVVSAALVISLQDVCTSMFGWFVIMLGGKFGIGDRLEVDTAKGDVIDIQLLRTTLLEINGWLGTDQPTGRVVILPNNFIFKTKIFNYTHGHPFIWGKIEVTVTYATPVATAMTMLMRVLSEETTSEFAAAREAAGVMRKRYGVDDAHYEPKIHTQLADSGVKFILYYVSHYKHSSSLRNRINRRLIAELETHPQIQLAYQTMSVLHAPAAEGAPSAVLGMDATTPPFPVTATTAEPPVKSAIPDVTLGDGQTLPERS
ncbi:MAG TPA: mechanosensitive ion channel domain-containing protein [Opitutaceae bacterium]|nr:mechanosensitive ion channel domain-containing protein [Opitutaceae bacterium]